MAGPVTGGRAAHYAAITAACLIWGVSFVVSKIMLGVMGPFSLVAARFVLSAIGLAAAMPFLKFDRITRSDFKFFLAACTFEPGVYYMLETVGLARTDPTSAALIIASIPVLVIVLARFATGEELTAAKTAGAGISIAGVFLVTTGGMGGEGRGSTLLGNALVFGAVVAASCFTVMISRLAKRYSSLTLTRFQIFFAALFFMPFGAFEFSQGGIAPFAAIHAIGLAFLALFSGLAAFFLYNFSLTGLEVGRMAVFVNLIPVFTAFFSWLLMGEKLALVHILGGSLVLGGVMTANLRRRTVEPPGEIY